MELKPCPFYDLPVETVMRAWDFREFSDAADRLADLIEPEPERTCHIDVASSWGMGVRRVRRRHRLGLV